MFSVLDRYILRQVAVPLVACLSIGLMMLLAERMVRVLDTTLGKKSSFLSAFELMAYLVPHFLGTAVPAALFLGLLFGFSKISKNSEIDAMMAVGIGLHNLARPVLLLAVVFSLVSLAIFGWMQPYTRYAYRNLLFDIRSIDAFFLAEEGVFMQADSRTFILDRLDRENSRFERIFLFEDRGENGSETLTASGGVLITLNGQQRPVLRLENGHRLDIPLWPGKSGAAPPRPATVGTFEVTETPLGKVSKDIFRPRGHDERELTLPELISQLDQPPEGATLNSMRAELHRKFVNVAVMLLLPILAMPFAIGRVRSPRSYRIGVAVVLIIAFHELIERGAVATRVSGYSPWLTLWLPTVLLAVFSFWRFYKLCFSMQGEGMDRVLAPVQEFFARLTRRFRRKKAMGGSP